MSWISSPVICVSGTYPWIGIERVHTFGDHVYKSYTHQKHGKRYSVKVFEKSGQYCLRFKSKTKPDFNYIQKRVAAYFHKTYQLTIELGPLTYCKSVKLLLPFKQEEPNNG
jgi:hypothetical protein